MVLALLHLVASEAEEGNKEKHDDTYNINYYILSIKPQWAID